MVKIMSKENKRRIINGAIFGYLTIIKLKRLVQTTNLQAI
jgi:hypothetical protein